MSSDFRLAFRSLRSTPVATAVAILSLALGIGANTAIFSLIDALLMRHLPVRAPERLVTISSESALRLGMATGLGWTLPMWQRFREHRGAFDGACTWSPERLNLSRRGQMQPADGLLVDGEFFDTLGVPALIGRTFTAADDVPGGGPDGPVAVISAGFWQRRFGGSISAIGQSLVIADTPFTIVGVTPSFTGIDVGRTFDVAVPSAMEDLLRPMPPGRERRSFAWLVMLRLAERQSLSAATAQLRALQPAILGVAPEAMASVRPGILAEPYVLLPAPSGTSSPWAGVRGLRQRYTRPLLILLGVVALVLLVACANIANLLLARALARRHELSVRRALGASRWDLARLCLAESLVLAACGGAVGTLIAWQGGALMLVSGAVTLIGLGALAAWLPALRIARIAPAEVLRPH